jgi:hypothetical protein
MVKFVILFHNYLRKIQELRSSLREQVWAFAKEGSVPEMLAKSLLVPVVTKSQIKSESVTAIDLLQHQSL